MADKNLLQLTSTYGANAADSLYLVQSSADRKISVADFFANVRVNVVPAVANTFNLGSADRPWHSLYVSNSTIYIGGQALSTDGSRLLLNGSSLTTDIIDNSNTTFLTITAANVYSQAADGHNAQNILRLIPDANLAALDRYIVVDPMLPESIHIRAGGAKDNSLADIALGAEFAHVKVEDSGQVRIQIHNNDRNYLTLQGNNKSTVSSEVLVMDVVNADWLNITNQWSIATEDQPANRLAIKTVKDYVSNSAVTSQTTLLALETHAGHVWNLNETFTLYNTPAGLTDPALTSTISARYTANIPELVLPINANARIVFSDNSRQTTAWLGVGPTNSIATAPVPTTSTDAGTKGEVRFDSTHVYICTDSNTWRRISLENW